MLTHDEARRIAAIAVLVRACALGLAVMPPRPGSPMTLGNMRSFGVRYLAVTCELCHHEAVLSADDWPRRRARARFQSAHKRPLRYWF